MIYNPAYKLNPDDPLSPTRISWHGVIASLSAATTFGFLATWASGHISPQMEPFLLLATFSCLATSLLGTTIAIINRNRRPTYSTLPVVLTATVIILTIAILLQPNNALWRAVGRHFG